MKTEQPAKLAIILQICPLDCWIAKRLAQLICDIEPQRRSDIEFIVSARRGTNTDCTLDIVNIAKTKFDKVLRIDGKRFGTGWPMGCNDLWQETMMRLMQLHEAGKSTASGALTFESDCLPLRPDWLDRLADEWRMARSTNFDVVGHAHGEPCTHINGNAMFAWDILARYPELNGCDSTQGWDAFHGHLLRKIGYDTPLIYQQYRIPNTTRAKVKEIQKGDFVPALFHGIKGLTGLEAVESMLADGTFFTRPL